MMASRIGRALYDAMERARRRARYERIQEGVVLVFSALAIATVFVLGYILALATIIPAATAEPEVGTHEPNTLPDEPYVPHNPPPDDDDDDEPENERERPECDNWDSRPRKGHGPPQCRDG